MFGTPEKWPEFRPILFKPLDILVGIVLILGGGGVMVRSGSTPIIVPKRVSWKICMFGGFVVGELQFDFPDTRGQSATFIVPLRVC